MLWVIRIKRWEKRRLYKPGKAVRQKAVDLENQPFIRMPLIINQHATGFCDDTKKQETSLLILERRAQ